MTPAFEAALWGGLAGGALLVGAAVGYLMQVPRIVSAGVMAFGVGVLVACLAFNLMPEAITLGGVWPASLGFVLGGGLFAGANAVLARNGAKHRKRAKGLGAGATASLAIALGALLDGIPEAAAIGTSLLDGHGVALVTVLAVFISNLPEGLSSTVGMKTAGLSGRFIFGLWGSIMVACVISAWLGYVLIGGFGPFWVAIAVASAAGAIFVMIIDTMIPEAFEEIHAFSGPIAAAGFLLTFISSQTL
ncbi:MAG: ZIP family zinc transporter [Rhodobacterales bacterium]|nr:MAG: ZIP family zinc transporter [Rhodobacterales bacterium]